MTTLERVVSGDSMIPIAVHAPITYDRYGRMRYHPEFHAKQTLPWTTIDERFLIENYEQIGPEEVSLALERTIQTVMTRAYELRKRGLMPKPKRKVVHRRTSFGLRVAIASNP